MRYRALICDYDGTIASNGLVDRATMRALEQLRESGRTLILVTGRELDDLRQIFSRLDLFDVIVAENGALLYRPDTREEKLLAEAPPEQFVEALAARGVVPISVGRVIVATIQPWEGAVLNAIRELGIELQVIFNKGAVMVLPSGVNKASGLKAALSERGLSRHNIVGVGDAENDHTFLSLCECSVAVANALPMIKERADVVMKADDGAGVAELIERLIHSDLDEVENRKNLISLGTRSDGSAVSIRPYDMNLVVAGQSVETNIALAGRLVKSLAENEYQVCVIDPDGRYGSFDRAIVLGSSDRPPNVTEVLDILMKPAENVVVNLVALTMDKRTAYVRELLLHLRHLQIRIGRPHWLVLDGPYDILPVFREVSKLAPGEKSCGLSIIAQDLHRLPSELMPSIDLLIATGKDAQYVLQNFEESAAKPRPIDQFSSAPSRPVAWFWRTGDRPFAFDIGE